MLSGKRLRYQAAPDGLPSLDKVQSEIEEYIDTLMGRLAPPFDAGVGTLMEYASAALGRALEIQMKLHKAEADGQVPRGSRWNKFRTGELRDFIDLAKNAVDLGSRRITMAQIEADMKGSY